MSCKDHLKAEWGGVERVHGFRAANELELVVCHRQRKLEGKTICCESLRAITIAGAKQEEPEKQFLKPCLGELTD